MPASQTLPSESLAAVNLVRAPPGVGGDHKVILLVTFDDWANNVYIAYESRDPKEGKAKLALLNFWYDALKYHDKDPEFWTDMLYFGLKIIAKGQFGQHIKIS